MNRLCGQTLSVEVTCHGGRPKYKFETRAAIARGPQRFSDHSSCLKHYKYEYKRLSFSHSRRGPSRLPSTKRVTMRQTHSDARRRGQRACRRSLRRWGTAENCRELAGSQGAKRPDHRCHIASQALRDCPLWSNSSYVVALCIQPVTVFPPETTAQRKFVVCSSGLSVPRPPRPGCRQLLGASSEVWR